MEIWIDSTNLIKIISDIKPDEVYNLAAQSHVAVSFETPEYTGEADALGVLKILEAIRTANLSEQTKFIKHLHQIMGWFRKCPKPKKLHFIKVHMV